MNYLGKGPPSFPSSETKEWDVARINESLPELTHQILRIKPSVLEVEDAYIWPLQKSGNYSTKSGYYAGSQATHASSIAATATATVNWKKLIWTPRLSQAVFVEAKVDVRVFCEHIGLDLYCLLSHLDPNESLGIKIDQHREQKIDVQLAQTVESVKRQQGTLPGKTDKNPRTEHCNAIEQSFAETAPGAEERAEQPTSSAVTAPDESAETPPYRVYVPKVPYPIPPRHLMDPISEDF
ncbi:hypothetical protein F2Q70_00026961 [Brassica cretica]|uniref:Uncharacterized protein n=1 Tax=Brassica cretica TaxID=69181 RepID=A0A8S9LBX0_BRACR|nr:hypothetical protein F2Q70_00026961 [Brassica cretica]